MNALIFPWLLSYLFNALWQIPLVFTAAWIASRMLRRASPRIEHRLWVGALLLQLVLPACNLRIGDLFTGLLSWLSQGQGSAVHDGHIRVLIGPPTATGDALHLPLALEAALLLLFACMVFYFAARLAWGLVQTRALSRNAIRITLTGEVAQRWTAHCDRLGITAPPPEIAASPQGIGPVTVGIRHRLVLVPSSFLESIPADDLDAVFAHELAHIQRHDFAKNLLYGLLSLPIAWHPAVWRTRARVAESRELVCDATAANSIAAEAAAGRRQYAQSLLRLAAMLAGQSPVTLHAIGIFSLTDAGTLERRVMTLTHQPAPISASRRILVAAACCIVALATCTTALALRTDVSALAPSAQNQAPDTAAPTKIHVKSSIMVHQKISGANPTYPKEARAKKIQGTVVLDATISKDGAIENLQVTKTPDKLLSQSALDAVRTWRYRPYLLNGEPVEVKTTINVVYSLGG